MAHLAMRGSAFVNAVSRKHGDVSRHLFTGLFPRWPEAEVPIGQIANGVHVPSWDSQSADELWTRSCGKQRWIRSVEPLSAAIAGVPDEQLWKLRGRGRRNLVLYSRDRLRRQLAWRGDPGAAEALHVLDPNVLTLGFARRFAEYKRTTLLLTDSDRLIRLLRNAARPVQIVVAGKAHPEDNPGKQMIAEWIAFVSRSKVRDRAVFIEDYDMTVAERMVEGVDLSLNTPRPPWEACGTSGMKVLANGGLNLSELDGWWTEAFSSDCGWAIGGSEPRSDVEDAQKVYALLEDEIVPAFYERDGAGIPRNWVGRMRASMSRLAPEFSSNRMVREYIERLYTPAAEAFQKRVARGAVLARELSAWEEHVTSRWRQVHFGAAHVEALLNGFNYRIAVYLGELAPEHVRVDLYANSEGEQAVFCIEMKRREELAGATGGHSYAATIATARPDTDFTARIRPRHPDAFIPIELPLILWQR